MSVDLYRKFRTISNYRMAGIMEVDCNNDEAYFAMKEEEAEREFIRQEKLRENGKRRNGEGRKATESVFILFAIEELSQVKKVQRMKCCGCED